VAAGHKIRIVLKPRIVVKHGQVARAVEDLWESV